MNKLFKAMMVNSNKYISISSNVYDSLYSFSEWFSGLVSHKSVIYDLKVSNPGITLTIILIVWGDT